MQITAGNSACCNARHSMCLELCIYMSHACHTMSYHVIPCHTMSYHVLHHVMPGCMCSSRVLDPTCVTKLMLLFVRLQDLKKKEGGSDGRAEELTDGAATKAGKHKLVNHMLSFCKCFTLREGIFCMDEQTKECFSISSGISCWLSLCFATK